MSLWISKERSFEIGRDALCEEETDWVIFCNDKHRQVSNALNGKRCKITLDDDPAYYYDGRLAVKKYSTDRLLRQITIEATCKPYRLKQQVTMRSSSLKTTAANITLTNDRKPVVPTILVTTETQLTWKGSSYVLGAGRHKVLDIELQEGENVLTAKTTSGSGSISVEYQEGAL